MPWGVVSATPVTSGPPPRPGGPERRASGQHPPMAKPLHLTAAMQVVRAHQRRRHITVDDAQPTQYGTPLTPLPTASPARRVRGSRPSSKK